MLRAVARSAAATKCASATRALPLVTRPLSTTSIVKADLIQELYLNEIRAYKPKPITEKVELPSKFSPPTPPAKPELEGAVVEASATSAVEESIEEEQWPALYNPIDDPANYNTDFDFTTENDDGSWYPKRLTKAEYHDHH
ncbi:hypothetical protein BJ742DRAFT_800405 [Cladochytrium replicatum]|nr:hypothetical protein BJ742DRAFT_800405 [Cladochytrium replicatum]